MAYISNDTEIRADAGKGASGFLSALSAGFVSIMNHLHHQAMNRLPKVT